MATIGSDASPTLIPMKQYALTYSFKSLASSSFSF
nr:MAG TPA: hypothetical protein [Bacteriophage sp.]